MFSPNWASDYEDYLPEGLDRGNVGLWESLLEVTQDKTGEDRNQEVGSQPFHPSLSSTQGDTLDNIPKQGNETVEKHSTNDFGERKEFGTHQPIRGELQTFEDDSSLLSNSAHNLTSRSCEQEVSRDDLLNSIEPCHAQPEKLLSTKAIGEWKEFGSQLLTQGELQVTASTQSVDVASDSVMDYTNEFTNNENFKNIDEEDAGTKEKNQDEVEESEKIAEKNHKRTAIIGEMDFFTDKNHDHVKSNANNSDADHKKESDRPAGLQLKVNTGLNLLTTNTSSDQSMVDDGISTTMEDKKSKNEYAVIQAELDRAEPRESMFKRHVKPSYKQLQQFTDAYD
ncbi:WRKY family transcription factor [Melia azedarach]|uniref:WRKY family transcription factor n=1 Tax=Melia azedarach TaxID=155640 RepID=A0ACC1XWK6_MELAZ|nr:WRKY family transcription factor [Melia azedarach]